MRDQEIYQLFVGQKGAPVTFCAPREAPQNDSFLKCGSHALLSVWLLPLFHRSSGPPANGTQAAEAAAQQYDLDPLIACQRGRPQERELDQGLGWEGRTANTVMSTGKGWRLARIPILPVVGAPPRRRTDVFTQPGERHPVPYASAARWFNVERSRLMRFNTQVQMTSNARYSLKTPRIMTSPAPTAMYRYRPSWTVTQPSEDGSSSTIRSRCMARLPTSGHPASPSHSGALSKWLLCPSDIEIKGATMTCAGRSNCGSLSSKAAWQRASFSTTFLNGASSGSHTIRSPPPIVFVSFLPRSIRRRSASLRTSAFRTFFRPTRAGEADPLMTHSSKTARYSSSAEKPRLHASQHGKTGRFSGYGKSRNTFDGA